MSPADCSRADFIDRVLTSRIAGAVAKRFQFADGEVGALYTLSQSAPAGVTQPVVLFVATFPPALPQPGVHDFGIDYCEQPVASVAEAAELLARFNQAQAARITSAWPSSVAGSCGWSALPIRPTRTGALSSSPCGRAKPPSGPPGPRPKPSASASPTC